MKRLFTLLLISFAALSCEMIDEKLDDLLDKRDWVVFAEGTELTANVPSKQTVLNYKFESTLDWEVKTDAEWLEIDPTSGKAGKDIKIQIKVAKNKDKEGRTGYADLTLSNDESYRITINQAGENDEGDENDENDEGTIVDVPANQIWYTSVDGEIVEPYSGEYNEYADALKTFGVNIVSNTYVDGKGVIEFDGDVTVIGDYAFSFYNTITTLSFAKSVTTIGDYAFYGCISLTSVTIPDSVTMIGELAFHNCSSLQEFNSKFASEDGRCLIIDGTLISFAPAGLTEYTIPDSVTTIGNDAFSGCSNLKSVIIPNSVTTIGAFAFSWCESLTSVTIPDSVTSIGKWAFYECSSLTSVYYIGDISAWCNISFNYSFFNPFNLYLNNELVTDLTIPDSVTTIGESAFHSCDSLTSVTIPDSVTTIGEGAFENCSSLESVTIGNSVTTIGYAAFYNCGSLKSVTIPNSVTTIGDNAFVGCGSLTSVTIPDSVTTIGYAAFYGCKSLTSVTIPDSVTTIGYSAFSGCRSLTSVTIPDSVTTIGNYAFFECTSLTSVYCKAVTPPAAILNDFGYWDAFNNNASDREIYVPMESVEAYKSASGWSDYADDIIGYDF